VCSLDLLQERSFAIDSSQPCYLLFSHTTARTSPALVNVGMSHSDDIASLDHIRHWPAHLAPLFALNEPCRLPCTYPSYEAMAKQARRRRAAGHTARKTEI